MLLRELSEQTSEFFRTYDRGFVSNMKWSDADHNAIDVEGAPIQDTPPPPPPGATPNSS